MNLHPLFVHFPVALLSLYAVFEIFGPLLEKRMKSIGAVRETLLYIGAIGAWLSYLTGEQAEHLVGGGALVELHETVATTTLVLFAILAISYVLLRLMPFIKKIVKQKQIQVALKALDMVLNLILHPIVRVLLALVALGFLVVTGSLGGAIAHGPETDPVVSFIYHLFF